MNARFEVVTLDAQGETLVRSSFAFPSTAQTGFDRACKIWTGYRTQLKCIANGRVMRDTGKGETVVPEGPIEKRSWLPCGCHQFKSVEYEHTIACCVIEPSTSLHVTEWSIDKRKKGWQDLLDTSRELADKNHPKSIGRLNRCRVVPEHVQRELRRKFNAV